MKTYVVLWQGEKFIRAFDTVLDAFRWNLMYYDGDLAMTLTLMNPEWIKEAEKV